MLKEKELKVLISIQKHTKDFNEFARTIPSEILKKIFGDYKEIYQNQNLTVVNFIDTIDNIELNTTNCIKRTSKNLKNPRDIDWIDIFKKPDLDDFSEEEYKKQIENFYPKSNTYNINNSTANIANGNNIQQQLINNSEEIITKFIDYIEKQDIDKNKKDTLINWVKSNGVGIAGIIASFFTS